jgi:hypothetical protein
MTDQDLRDLLREAPTPPTRLTTASLVDQARRSIRRRRYGLTGTAAAGVALAIVGTTSLVAPRSPDRHPGIVAATPSTIHTTPPTAMPTQSAATCTVQALTLPSGVTHVEAYSIAPSGHSIVGTGPHNEVVLWRDGVPSVLQPVAQPDDPGVMIGGVNAAGVIVGTTLPSPTTSRAWIYRNGTVTTLPAPPGYPQAFAKAVNAAGDVAGFAIGDGDQHVAAIWPAAAPGTVTVLTAPPSSYGAAAYGIGDDGTVVGELVDGEHPYYWQASGQGHRAGEDPSVPGGRITAISGDWAVGWVAADTGPTLAPARWNVHTDEMTIFKLLAGHATAVAADGTFLLAIEAPTSTTLRIAPGTGGASPLPNVVPPGRIDARGISADGRTVIGDIDEVAVVWHC